MPRLRGLIFILVAILAAIAASFAIGIRETVAQRAGFAQEGFVLERAQYGEAAVTRHSVPEGGAYRLIYPARVAFARADGGEARVRDASFIHYINSATSAFSDGVIADLSKVESGFVDCYTVNAGTLMVKENGVYTVEGRAEALALEHFIWKLSDEKYMLCSESIHFVLPDGSTKDLLHYAEIDYLGDGAVAVYNGSGSFQTVAAGLRVRFGPGLEFQPEKKTVVASSGGEFNVEGLETDAEGNALVESIARVPVYQLLAMDGKNGELGALGEAGDSGDQGSDGELGQAGAAGSAGGAGSAGAAGAAGNVGVGGSTAGDVNPVVYMPRMTLADLSVSSTSIAGVIAVANEDSLALRPGQVKLYEVESGRLAASVQAEFYNAGEAGLAFSFEDLEPELQYRLIATADYTVMVSDVPVAGTADYINRTLCTDTIGMLPVVRAAGETTLIAGVKAEDWCIVRRAWLRLVDEQGETVRETPLDFTQAAPMAEFSGLAANTQYAVQLITSFREEEEIGGGRLSPNEAPCKTLKTYPADIGEPAVAVNQKGWFEICLDGKVTDPCNGIVRFTYEVCDTSGVVWKTVSSAVRDPVAVYTDQLYIRVGTTYRARARVEFFDNEKMAVYETDLSEEFVVYGDMAPKVSFRQDAVTHEAIAGAVVVDVSSVTPVINENQPVLIVVEAPGYYYFTQVEHGVEPVGGRLTIPVSIAAGLKAETAYRFTVSGYADLYGGGEAMKSEWGSFLVTTAKKD